jgi:cell wall assembly regulator SMI1
VTEYPNVSKLKRDRTVIKHGPVTLRDVTRAEVELGLQFPDEYRTFLRVLGWVEMGVVNVYGLGRDLDTDCDVVFLTKAWRKSPMPWWQHGFVPLYDVGNGDTTYLSCAVEGQQPTRDVGHVFHWLHESDERIMVASTFDKWIGRILADPDRFAPWRKA